MATCLEALNATQAAADILADDSLADDQAAEAVAGVVSSVGAEADPDELIEWVQAVRSQGAEPTEEALALAVTQRFTWPGPIADEAVRESLAADFARQGVTARAMAGRIGDAMVAGDQPVDPTSLAAWVDSVRQKAKDARQLAKADAKIARLVFFGVLTFFVVLAALSDIACRGRIGRMIEETERTGGGWEDLR